MVEVVPAVLEQTFDDVKAKVKIIKEYTNFIQLDVMDGQFVPNTTFANPKQAAELDIEMELHLMINMPELHIKPWALDNVRRIIVHYEATTNLAQVIKHVKQAGKEVGVAINPGTSTFEIKEYVNDLDLVLVMGVNPGFSGQHFEYDVLEKIKEVKSYRPDILVEVDGGVNGKTRDVIVEAGCDILAAASFIWKADDMAQAIHQLKTGEKPAEETA